MTGLTIGAGVDARTLDLVNEALPADEVRAGAPTTALHPLARIGETEVGV